MNRLLITLFAWLLVLPIYAASPVDDEELVGQQVMEEMKLVLALRAEQIEPVKSLLDSQRQRYLAMGDVPWGRVVALHEETVALLSALLDKQQLHQYVVYTSCMLGPINTNFEPAPEAIFSRNKAH